MMFHMIRFPFLLIMLATYFLPTIIAIVRNKANLVGILLVNLFLGWSVIGWIVALVWAVSTERIDQGYSAPMVSMSQAARRFCSRCGTQDQLGSRFCAHCGGAFNT